METGPFEQKETVAPAELTMPELIRVLPPYPERIQRGIEEANRGELYKRPEWSSLTDAVEPET